MSFVHYYRSRLRARTLEMKVFQLLLLLLVETGAECGPRYLRFCLKG